LPIASLFFLVVRYLPVGLTPNIWLLAFLAGALTGATIAEPDGEEPPAPSFLPPRLAVPGPITLPTAGSFFC
jgi:hypothetical protein